MNTLLDTQRTLRDMDNKEIRMRETHIQKIMYSFGYDRENAERVFELGKVRQVESMVGIAAGALAVYKTGPLRKECAQSYGLFRKAWMRYPAPIVVFAVGYTLATMVPQRLGRKLSWAPRVTTDVYTSETDLVGRFRVFENHANANQTHENHLAQYLATYSSDALTEPEIISKLDSEAQKLAKLKKAAKYQIKRFGKDADDFFWTYGKIHGLENICFLSKEEIAACDNNPVKLQIAINNVKIPKGHPQTYEQRVIEFKNSLDSYKAGIDSQNLTVTDRKKLLALPFYMMKRQEKPVPKKGQNEYRLFEELYGVKWDSDKSLDHDAEEKITEFNFEKFIH